MEVIVMMMKRTFLTTALVLMTAGALVACGQDAEQNNVEESMSNAGDVSDQTLDYAGNAVG